MRAAVLVAQGTLELRELPDPVPGPGELLVRVAAASLCGSDIHRYVRGHRTYPIVLGHEAAGTVAGVGPGVDAGLVGTRGAIVPLVPDHTCAECRAGRFSACGAYSFLGSRRDGAFAELVTLPVANLLPTPDALSFDAAALIEPATVARHLLDLGGAAAGRSAVVLGAGSIGLMLVQWLRIAGLGPIVATDVVPANLEAALALGATAALDPRAVDLGAEVRALIPGGADLVLEASGSPAALDASIDVARTRGTIVLGGNQPPDATLPMSWVERLMRKELSLSGGFMSYSAPWPGHEWTDSLAAAVEGAPRGLDMAAMISHRLPLTQAPATLEAIGARRLAHRKIVFDPSA